MSDILILLKHNDNILEVTGLVNELTGVTLNAATVPVTLKDAAGANVAGDTWPKTLTYVTGSDGAYHFTLDYLLTLTAASRYTAAVIADAGAGLWLRGAISQTLSFMPSRSCHPS